MGRDKRAQSSLKGKLDVVFALPNVQAVTRGHAAQPKSKHMIGTWSQQAQVSWNVETKLTLNIMDP